VIISYSQKFLFVHATKTAGMSVARALEPFGSKPELFWYNKLLDNMTLDDVNRY